MTLIKLQSEPLSIDEAVQHVSHAQAGGIAVFLGIVRNLNEGRPVTLLEYEAYAPMAVKEMERIAQDIAAEMPGIRLSALHRTGALQVGDVAVVCTASAPHRTEAFAACRKLIDRIKEQVPIWKREHGPEGAYWVGWEDARCASGDDHHGHHEHR